MAANVKPSGDMGGVSSSVHVKDDDSASEVSEYRVVAKENA